MKTHRIPSVQEVRDGLNALAPLEVRLLSKTSGVPHMTLRNIRNGTSTNPGIETVRKFSTLLTRALAARSKSVKSSPDAGGQS